MNRPCRRFFSSFLLQSVIYGKRISQMQMAEDRAYRRGQVRIRGCNESFRAAVDRSYEATHHVGMDPCKYSIVVEPE